MQIHPPMFKTKFPGTLQGSKLAMLIKNQAENCYSPLIVLNSRGFHGDSYSQTSRCGAGTLQEGLEHGIRSAMELPFLPSPLFSNLRLYDFFLEL